MGPALSAAAARMERDAVRSMRAGRPAPPVVTGRPIDRRLMLAAALGLAGALGLTGIVAAWLARPPAPAGPVVVSALTARPLVLPAAWLVRPGAAAEAVPDRIDLAIPWSDLTDSRLPGLMRVTATRAPETEAPLSPARRYARFLTAEAQPLPEGLMRRRFRAGTPFEGEDLYLAQGEGSRFAARCATGPSPEPDAACLSEIRIGNLALRLRFSAERLPSWSTGLAGLERLFGSSP
ncbi:hypothetical protein [Methylobacterium nonmethylotrophicum]|uniref:Uncharacterized protein n=1 Tax=Methylobacterium nonmethylotrophicum TaxID=1141884 RepID=A0A4Z0NVL6_9HYPH|nr:hypothetical protein [Methylobacterium nonmethylotrophicum]TGE00712.1 hypothetical protein EU555_08175 [Methylobacterium nonmethylotrophicum]